MYCEICGAVNDDNARKCKKCGYVFNNSITSDKDTLDEKVELFKHDNKSKIVGWRVKKNIIAFSTVLIVLLISVFVGFKYYNSVYKLYLVEEKDTLTGENKYRFYKNGVLIVNSFVDYEGNKYRAGKDGYMVKNQIETVDDKDYYFDEEGILVFDKWFKYNENDMYSYEDGSIAKNEWVDNKYLSDNGIMLKNSVADRLYYVDDNGYKVKSQWLNNHYYGDDGKMYINSRTPDVTKVDEKGDIVLPPEQQIFNSNFRFSSVIKFGSFEQDGNDENGTEPIEWYLLRGQYDKAMLISKNVLMCLPYQIDEFATEENFWKDSYLKNHLKGWFYNLAFDDIEKESIYVDESLGEVFVPSVNEMNMYLPNDLYKMCSPTSVAKDSTKFSQINSMFSIYWLRDDGVDGKHKAFVTDMGQIITNDSLDELLLSESFVVNPNSVSITDDLADKIQIYLSTQMPLVSDTIKYNKDSKLLVESIYTSIINKLKNDGYQGDETSNIDYKKIIDEYFEKNDNISELIKTQKISTKNIYKDVGRVTNEFNGVRPMILINMKSK